MSYDIEIWSVLPADLPASLPSAESWNRNGDAWARESKSWDLVVEPSVEVLDEDVPEAVAALLPGIRYLTEIQLRPVRAPWLGRRLLKRTARQIARQARGVVLDRQEDTILTPSGVKRYPKPPRSEASYSVLRLTWFFAEGPLLQRQGTDQLIDVLQSTVPEVLPRRYGLYEPPKHRLEREGLTHLRSFIHDNLPDGIVWYPTSPVAHVHVRADAGSQFTRGFFRANMFYVEVEADALAVPGWQGALQDLWRRVSTLVQPFYADVRVLGGFVGRGTQFTHGEETEQHPIRGPWWNGVPRTLGRAVCVGPPYQSVWPSFGDGARKESGLWFRSLHDWGAAGDVGDTCPPPDGAIRRFEGAPFQAQGEPEYPSVWPLPGPRAEQAGRGAAT